MCNINILIKPNKKSYCEELNNASATSYATNSDSEGFYFDYKNTSKKSLNKINLAKFNKEIQLSKWLILHERISTSGYNFENTQPFINNRFVLVHNGVLDIKFKLTSNDKSDTNIFFNEFNKQFNKSNDIKIAIQESINNVCENYNSYSIFIFDRIEKQGYYFKNDRTNINVYRLKDNSLYITTNNNTHNFFSNILREYTINSNILYKIEIKGKKVIFENKGKLKFKYNKNKNYYAQITTKNKAKAKGENYYKGYYQNMSDQDRQFEQNYYDRITQEEYKPLYDLSTKKPKIDTNTNKKGNLGQKKLNSPASELEKNQGSNQEKINSKLPKNEVIGIKNDL